MPVQTYIKSIVSKKQLQFLKQVRAVIANVDVIAYDGRVQLNLHILKRKINILSKLFPPKMKPYAREIAFINEKSVTKNPFSYIIPYPFVFKYSPADVMVHKDHELGLLFVMHHGKRLYYSRAFQSVQEVKEIYASISIEQDHCSPHRYLSGNFNVAQGDVVVDIGAAEGNFALDVVDRAHKVYIFETDANWIEALKATFEPWHQKVEIIQKFVSNRNTHKCTTLETALRGTRIHFVKMDVEGAEITILKNSKTLIKKNPGLKLAVCTYHRKTDAHHIEKILKGYGCQCSFSNGYLLFLYSRLTPPYFRRGVLRAIC